MLDKYIKINEKVIESKQTSNGVWYCSSVTSETVKEMDTLIGELNKVYNKYNSKAEKAKKQITKVKGLK